VGHQASGVVSSAHATKSERMTTGVGNSMPLATGFLPAPCWPSTPTQQAARLARVGSKGGEAVELGHLRSFNLRNVGARS